MLQSLAHEPMMPTGMRHIYEQHQTGHVCAVCGALASTERGTNHLWTGSATTDHLAESCTTAAPQPTPVANPATLAVHDSVRVMSVDRESLVGRRQNLVRRGATGDGASRTLRDMFDPVGRAGLNV
jgi:ribosomal protein L37AE/L43A